MLARRTATGRRAGKAVGRSLESEDLPPAANSSPRGRRKRVTTTPRRFGRRSAAAVLASPAFAADVNIRVEGDRATIWARRSVGLEPVTGTFSPPQGPDVTVAGSTPLGALERASRKGEFYRVRSIAVGLYVSRIGRRARRARAAGCLQNHILPPVGADTYQLEEGDDVLWYWATFGPTGRRRSILSGCAAAASVRSRTTTPATAPGRGTSSSCGTAAGRSWRSPGYRSPEGRGDAPGDEAWVVRLQPSELGPVGRVALEGVLRALRRPRPRRVPGGEDGSAGAAQAAADGGATLWVTRETGAEVVVTAQVPAGDSPPGARPSRRRGDPVRRAVRPGGERDQGQPRRSARLVLLRERHRARRRRGRGRAQRGRRGLVGLPRLVSRMAAPVVVGAFRSRSCTAGTESGGRLRSTRRRASTPRRTRCYVCSAAPAARGSRMSSGRGRA